MAGYLRQRGDGWQLIVYAGQGRQVSKTVHGSRRAAEKELAKLVTQVDAGKIVASRGRTVLTLLNAWHDARAPGWSDKTVSEHRRFIDKTIAPIIGALPLARLSVAEIDAFYAGLRRRGLAPGSVRRIHNVVRSACSQAVRWGWMGSNPAEVANVPAVPRSRVRPPTADELARLLDAIAGNPDFYLYVHLAAASGARRGELIRLRWADILGSGEMVVQKGKTEAATRRLALDGVTLQLLADHRELQRARAKSCGVRVGKQGFVFSDEADASEPWKDNRATQAFVRLRKRAGVSGVRLHDLRHYVATQLITAGVDVRTVAGRLGHASANVTLGVYSHFQPASDRAAADLLAQLLQRSQDKPDKSD